MLRIYADSFTRTVDDHRRVVLPREFNFHKGDIVYIRVADNQLECFDIDNFREYSRRLDFRPENFSTYKMRTVESPHRLFINGLCKFGDRVKIEGRGEYFIIGNE